MVSDSFSIVGGGITGCILSLQLLQKGHSVTLYEAGTQLGGILRDLEYSGEFYFNGCQYLNPNTLATTLLQSIPSLEIEEFDHHYGSWNDLFGEVVTHDDFAQIVVPGQAKLPQLMDGCTSHSLSDRLSQYEPKVSQALLEWVSQIHTPYTLQEDCCVGLQIGRVFYRDDANTIHHAKQKNSAMDAIYGLPRSFMSGKNSSIQKGYLPQNGFNALFEKLGNELLKLGGEIHLNSPVKRDQEKEVFVSRRESLSSRNVIWCTNPVPLGKYFLNKSFESPLTSCVVVSGHIDLSEHFQPFYVQCFSLNHPILRIFIYTLGTPKVSIEALKGKASAQEIAKISERILRSSGINLNISNIHEHESKRYNLLTTHDSILIKELERKIKPHGIIPGGWQHYGRDKKISHIIEQLNERELTT